MAKGTKTISQEKVRRQDGRSSEKKRMSWTSTCATWSHLLVGETVAEVGAEEEASTAVGREGEAVVAETDTEDEATASFVADTGGVAVDVAAPPSTSRTKMRFPALAARSCRLSNLIGDRLLLLKKGLTDLDGRRVSMITESIFGRCLEG